MTLRSLHRYERIVLYCLILTMGCFRENHVDGNNEFSRQRAHKCEINVETRNIIHPHFGGVGFHVSQHVHPTNEAHLNQVIYKRWRELNPSFARVCNNWGRLNQAKLDTMAERLACMKSTGTEIYTATFSPKDTKEGAERVAYAKQVVDNLEYLVREKKFDNIKYYCMTNELSLGEWANLRKDLPKFKDYHQKLYEEFQARNLNIKLLATDASPIEFWNTIEWATQNMDDITGVYGGHHYINDYKLEDEEFYPWFLSKMKWGAGMAKSMRKNFILGEFGAKQDRGTINGVRNDACTYWDTHLEPMVGIQLSEAVIAALNGGIYALANWTFTDYPDSTRGRYYINKWGTFKWGVNEDYSTRAHYYAYGLLTKFFRGPASVFTVNSSDKLLRVAAVQHHRDKTISIAIVNRRKANVPVIVKIAGEPLTAAFRKYVYDPRNVPFHPFGDLQEPRCTVSVKDGRFSDKVSAGTLTVYTTAYDDKAPGPVKGLTVENTPEGNHLLRWQANTEPDLCYYRIYRSEETDFLPGVQNQVGSTIATEFIDESIETEWEYKYKVLAVDQSGNASKY